MANEAMSMRRLRQWRREQGLCAQCGNHQSEKYLCVRCEERRMMNRWTIEQQREERGECTKCGKPLNGNVSCPDCYSKYPLRKLKTWRVMNKRLYESLDQAKISIPELADALGFQARTVERWIFEGSTPNRANAQKVAQFFEKPANYFFKEYADHGNEN
ncbi:hypothetical protein BVG16_01660 [Paenibacillus selenitireducens]|uniref:HTH cro/C1-type domain-containing protein n=1 Tax=Paenibacillus selenitireducens TaxID=1324314 RepID=A0A1T2XN06_9BACL|nr:helix-turn-helix transcriptional regulator [Paenibacillus selenitireducens]OPA81073.1 hypothetical protein BVG16_01660 [Paenibacillus selenitireducens]